MTDHESRKRTDAVTGQETTGHEWDGIEELDTPLPRWWLWVFYATIVWSIGYWVLMPAWPLVGDYTRGMLGYSQRDVVAQKIAAAQAAQAPFARRLISQRLEDVRNDAELLDFAIRAGRSAFAVNCSQCHGAGAAGSRGYPNLNDDAWIWGGTVADIERTIRVGIRADHPETRVGVMPAFGRDQILPAADIAAVADYVISLGSGTSGRASRGATVFAEQCAACHGPQGKGNPEMGAPDLADAIWLYGGTRTDIMQTLQGGRGGVMPGWHDRLDESTIKALAIYVHALGGGK